METHLGDPRVIDTKMHGREGITASYLFPSERPALLETGPKSAVDNVLAELETAGIDELAWIIVTHVHLDHAGAAGTLAKHFPSARVAVHEVGAPHLIEPSKLWASATRIYGAAAMDSLWGGIDPVPRDRVHVVRDQDTIDLGDRRLVALDTPGHAYHHHTYLDPTTGACFTGDALGVRLPGVATLRPTTPPPEFHLDRAIDSIRRIEGAGAGRLWFTHYGPQPDASVGEICHAAVEALRRWEEWVRKARTETHDVAAAAAIVKGHARAALEREISEEDVARLEQTTSYAMNTGGYMRYLDKEEEGS